MADYKLYNSQINRPALANVLSGAPDNIDTRAPVRVFRVRPWLKLSTCNL